MFTELRKMCPDCFNMNYSDVCCPDCGFVNTPIKGYERALPVGTLLGNRYLIGRVLGIGGFGITYKAYDTLYKSICAIKEYAPIGYVLRFEDSAEIRLHTSSSASQFEHGMMRFMQEAKILKSLKDIREVVQVYECFKENNTGYFSMEFLDGTNLKKLIKTMGRSISQSDITELFIKISSAMEVIHKTAGILHRDISPENICVLKDGSVKLLDFGSARYTSMKNETGFTVELKPGFAPLEQYSYDGKQGPYTDVYAIACTYYYALTGLTIPAAIDRLDGKTYSSLIRIFSEIEPRISEGVDKALELNYSKRIQTVREFTDILSGGTYVRASKPKRVKVAVPFLKVITGKTAGNKWRLPSDTEILLGRSHHLSNIILTSDPLISNVHCKIIYNQASNYFLLSDVSRNGTLVENKRLTQGHYYKFSPNFRFSMVSKECVVEAGVFYD